MAIRKVAVIGTGVQGSMIVQRLNDDAEVKEIICADANLKAAQLLENKLHKVTSSQVDGHNLDDIIKITQGADLLINALPPDFNPILMKAALKGNMHYQDMASGPVDDVPFIESVTRQLDLDEDFKKAGLTALINTGSAPGLVSVVAREAADKMDLCERIEIIIYDGIWTNRFIPFWWSPETAFGDMAAQAIVYEGGGYQKVPPFNNPVMFDFKGIGKRRVVDHEHEEPVTFPIFFKGLQHASMKYGGPALELSESLYKMGLLDKNPVNLNGSSVVPFDLVCKLTPRAPSSPASIRDALSEGMALEEGATLIRVEGKKDGRSIRIDSYINAPGLVECFEKHETTHEAFLTGQAAFLFSKLFVADEINLPGVYPPEMLGKKARNFYFQKAAELGITVDAITEEINNGA